MDVRTHTTAYLDESFGAVRTQIDIDGACPTIQIVANRDEEELCVIEMGVHSAKRLRAALSKAIKHVDPPKPRRKGASK